MLQTFNKKKKRLKETRGKLIVLESPLPELTTTQAQLLTDILQISGYPTQTFSFPIMGPKMQAFLGTQTGEDFNPAAASLWLALDRYEHTKYLQNMLNGGNSIVCTGYTGNTAAIQGKRILEHPARTAYYKWLHNLEFQVLGVPKPDLSIIIVPKSKQSAADFDTFMETSRLFPATKTVSVDTLDTAQEIHNKIWELVRRITLKN